jgi:hypothetical protein
MKTAHPFPRSFARQRAEAQFTGLHRRKATPPALSTVGSPVALNAAGFADLNATIRRGLHGFTGRFTIPTEVER